MLQSIVHNYRTMKRKLAPGGRLQKIISNTGWLFLDKIVRMGVGLIVSVWVARYLGPEQFGTLNFAQAFAFLFTPLVSLGLDGIVTRDLVNHPEDKEEIMGTMFVLKLLGSIVSTLLSVAVIVSMGENSQTILLVSIVAVGYVFQAFNNIDIWFQTNLDSKYAVYAKNIAYLFISVVKVVLILMNASLVAFALASLFELLTGAIGLLVAYRLRGYFVKHWRASYTRAKQLLHNSWPLILSGFVVMIYMKIDQIMIGRMMGDKAVGIYTAATKLSEVWYFIPTAIISSLSPSIIEARKAKNPGLYYARFNQLFIAVTAMAYLIVLFVSLSSSWLVGFLFGAEYGESSSVLMVHTWATIFVFLQLATGIWYIYEEQRVQAFMRNIIGALINIGLNFIMIPWLGITGAAISTIAAYFFVIVSPVVFSPAYRVLFKIILTSLLLRKVNHEKYQNYHIV